jgi:putative oxidoreductase
MMIDSIALAWAPRIQSLLRVVAGLEFLQHGTAKYLKVPIVPATANFQPLSLSGLGGAIELIGGILLILGLFTRPAAFAMSGMMAVAYFLVHFPRGFFPILNGGELAVLYCFVFLYFAFAGAGPWSLDALRRR